MRQGLSQNTQLKQELKINPRLYQAMDLLYMPLLDLQQHLKQELLNNPFLDMVEPEEDEEDEGEVQEESANPESEPEKDEKGEIDWEEILLDGFDAGGRREEHEEREYYEPVTVDSRDLSDHLRDQVSLLDLTPRQMYLADEFIGNINEDGYLACGLDKILEGVNESVQKAAEDSERELAEVPLYTMSEAEAMLGMKRIDLAALRRAVS
jgi:RNA polymerase sigma-54 factor